MSDKATKPQPGQQASASAASSQSTLRLLATALVLILAGCVVNNLVLEVIVSKKANPFADPGAGGLLTFLQFAFVAAMNLDQGFAFIGRESTRVVATTLSGSGGSSSSPDKPGTLKRLVSWLPIAYKTPQVPFRHYVYQTLLFFSMSYLNNWAFSFNISQPLHMLFRSANLITSFSLGYLFFGRKYTWKQGLCVAVLTFGAISATFAEATLGDTAKAAAAANAAALKCDGCENGGAAVPGTNALTKAASVVAAAATPVPSAGGTAFMVIWLIGVSMLTLVLVLQTCLGNYQSWVSDTYGRAPNEGMFFMHSLSLPAFLLTLPDMLRHAQMWTASDSTGVVLGAFVDRLSSSSSGASSLSQLFAWVSYAVTAPIHSLPVMWLWVALNVLSQYCCIRGVYLLTPLVDPLTVNVALTVRKFVSLMLSIVVFNNTFTLMHWLGAILVFGGALWYGQLPAPPKPTSGALVSLAGGASSSSSSSGAGSGMAATSPGATAGSLSQHGNNGSNNDSSRDDGAAASKQQRGRVGSLESGSVAMTSAVAAGAGGVVHHRGSGANASALTS